MRETLVKNLVNHAILNLRNNSVAYISIQELIIAMEQDINSVVIEEFSDLLRDQNSDAELIFWDKDIIVFADYPKRSFMKLDENGDLSIYKNIIIHQNKETRVFYSNVEFNKEGTKYKNKKARMIINTNENTPHEITNNNNKYRIMDYAAGPFIILVVKHIEKIKKEIRFDGTNFPCCGESLNQHDGVIEDLVFNFEEKTIKMDLWCNNCSEEEYVHKFKIHYTDIEPVK